MESDFKKKVLAVVSKIPKGQVMTYGQVAERAGRPKAARAVGAIMKQNYNPDVPCHRVVASGGKLGGYNRGIENKIKILVQEGALIPLSK
ncbi:MGMT family protein [Patescibacteria group bacterium]|nr:MAG: MGMT family protein [Patescibacteria group bacterium]